MVLAAFLGTWQPSTHSRGLSCPHLCRVGALRSRGGDWFVCMLSYLSLQHPSGCSGSASVPEFRTVDSDVLSLMALVEGLTFGAFCSAIFYDVTSPLGYLGLTTFGGNCSQFFFSFFTIVETVVGVVIWLFFEELKLHYCGKSLIGFP